MSWLAGLGTPGGLPGPSDPGPDPALIAGIAAYRRHPFQRDLADPPVVWRDGASVMRDFGGSGPRMLLVPSLVNRGTILDLAQGCSMARDLAAGGFRVVLLEWGWPGAAEREMDLDAMVTRRLVPALEALGAGTILVGYCMGGLLTLAAALARPRLVAGLALLATPWDFHAGDPEQGRAAVTLLSALEPLMAVTGTVPVDVLQWLFSLADPQAIADKYRAFGAMDQDCDRARRFVALEDWLSDGVPLAAPVARACIGGWYGANEPARLLWRVGGQVVDPGRLDVPRLVAIPSRDRIVPPDSALALAAGLPGATILRPAAGHVGMVAGEAAAAALWAPLAAWGRGLGRTRRRRARA